MIDTQDIPQAACVLVWKDGKVLAVSRHEDPSSFGFPCGKVEEGEAPDFTAKRELLEETGLIANDLSLVYQGFDGERVVYTYEGSISGEINTKEPHEIRWMEPSELVSGIFSDYNRAVFDAAGIEY